ncbi:predicted protein [Nematostella vectensis]|uniref:Nudix hydrolase domain-containing protein n=1 Tax=Nematostella vectensis TaxID=45351 RepID=A7RFF7_NEMVE|nr:predicted protein [Nematostella vectensis]|eukprot:XP_001641661.1 predicted protein [Nematostella vectensis]
MTSSPWSSNILKLVQRLNNFHAAGSSKVHCKPFVVDGITVGTILPNVLTQIRKYPDIFAVIKTTDSDEHVTLVPSLLTFEERTQKVNEVVQEFRKKDLFVTLRGWRDEMYAVGRSFSDRPFFMMERSAACLLGITQYGVHLNGYHRDVNGMLFMWVARRSLSKPTYPGKLDQLVAGGIPCGSNTRETLIKECAEEALIAESLAANAKPVGTVSYVFEDERGVFPEVQFVYDLELPESFTPKASDGEVSDFYYWPISKVKEMIATNEYKFNSALVVLDFLIRHGEVSPDTGK